MKDHSFELSTLDAISNLLSEIEDEVLISEMHDDAKECVSIICETVDGIIANHKRFLEIVKTARK